MQGFVFQPFVPNSGPNASKFRDAISALAISDDENANSQNTMSSSSKMNIPESDAPSASGNDGYGTSSRLTLSHFNPDPPAQSQFRNANESSATVIGNREPNLLNQAEFGVRPQYLQEDPITPRNLGFSRFTNAVKTTLAPSASETSEDTSPKSSSLSSLSSLSRTRTLQTSAPQATATPSVGTKKQLALSAAERMAARFKSLHLHDSCDSADGAGSDEEGVDHGLIHSPRTAQSLHLSSLDVSISRPPLDNPGPSPPQNSSPDSPPEDASPISISPTYQSSVILPPASTFGPTEPMTTTGEPVASTDEPAPRPNRGTGMFARAVQSALPNTGTAVGAASGVSAADATGPSTAPTTPALMPTRTAPSAPFSSFSIVAPVSAAPSPAVDTTSNQPPSPTRPASTTVSSSPPRTSAASMQQALIVAPGEEDRSALLTSLREGIEITNNLLLLKSPAVRSRSAGPLPGSNAAVNTNAAGNTSFSSTGGPLRTTSANVGGNGNTFRNTVHQFSSSSISPTFGGTFKESNKEGLNMSRSMLNLITGRSRSTAQPTEPETVQPLTVPPVQDDRHLHRTRSYFTPSSTQIMSSISNGPSVNAQSESRYEGRRSVSPAASSVPSRASEALERFPQPSPGTADGNISPRPGAGSFPLGNGAGGLTSTRNLFTPLTQSAEERYEAMVFAEKLQELFDSSLPPSPKNSALDHDELPDANRLRSLSDDREGSIQADDEDDDYEILELRAELSEGRVRDSRRSSMSNTLSQVPLPRNTQSSGATSKSGAQAHGRHLVRDQSTVPPALPLLSQSQPSRAAVAQAHSGAHSLSSLTRSTLPSYFAQSKAQTQQRRNTSPPASDDPRSQKSIPTSPLSPSDMALVQKLEGLLDGPSSPARLQAFLGLVPSPGNSPDASYTSEADAHSHRLASQTRDRECEREREEERSMDISSSSLGLGRTSRRGRSASVDSWSGRSIPERAPERSKSRSQVSFASPLPITEEPESMVQDLALYRPSSGTVMDDLIQLHLVTLQQQLAVTKQTQEQHRLLTTLLKNTVKDVEPMIGKQSRDQQTESQGYSGTNSSSFGAQDHMPPSNHGTPGNQGTYGPTGNSTTGFFPSTAQLPSPFLQGPHGPFPPSHAQHPQYPFHTGPMPMPPNMPPNFPPGALGVPPMARPPGALPPAFPALNAAPATTLGRHSAQRALTRNVSTNRIPATSVGNTNNNNNNNDSTNAATGSTITPHPTFPPGMPPGPGFFPSQANNAHGRSQSPRSHSPRAQSPRLLVTAPLPGMPPHAMAPPHFPMPFPMPRSTSNMAPGFVPGMLPNGMPGIMPGGPRPFPGNAPPMPISGMMGMPMPPPMVPGMSATAPHKPMFPMPGMPMPMPGHPLPPPFMPLAMHTMPARTNAPQVSSPRAASPKAPATRSTSRGRPMPWERAR